MDKRLRNIEIKYAIQKRWNPGDTEFDIAALKIESRRCGEVLENPFLTITLFFFTLPFITDP